MAVENNLPKWAMEIEKIIEKKGVSDGGSNRESDK